jgi:hypothetical protein
MLAPILGFVLAASLLTSCAGWNSLFGEGRTENAKAEEERRQLQQERQQLDQERRALDEAAKRQAVINQDLEEQLARARRALDEAAKRQAAINQGLEEQLARARRALDEAAKRQAVINQDLEEQLARARLSLLEKEAQVKLLTQKLDAAILEVVRSLAKLRSLESRAEAASNLAETEIALKVVERDLAGRAKPADVVQAEKLLAVAGQEFQKENYGGALYLAGQAKSLLKSGAVRDSSGENLPRVEGEIPFSLPLPLRVLSRGSVREGPGTNFKVSFPVAEGAAVTGHSYKGMWVRVRNEEGRLGWIFYSQVGQR